MLNQAYISIGSNIGDRRALIERAVTAISSLAEGEIKLSGIMETSPWGYDGGADFLNLCMAFPTSMQPLPLLRALLAIHRSIDASPHRNADGSYCDRAIDIDLVALGQHVVDSEELTLPHPRMHLRDFVLIPLREIAPQWIHPVLGLTPQQMIEKYLPEKS